MECSIIPMACKVDMCHDRGTYMCHYVGTYLVGVVPFLAADLPLHFFGPMSSIAVNNGSDVAKNGTKERQAMLTNEAVAKAREEGGPEAARAMILESIKEQTDAKKQKARRENANFTQVYSQGWNRLRELMKKDAQAATLYAFLAEQMGPDGTISASRATLAQALEIGERTVSRHVKSLEDLGAIIVLKNGTTNVYCLNPAEVWKSFDNAKPYAAFNTRTLVSKAENPWVKKRLAVLLEGQLPKEKTLLDVMEGHEDEGTGIDFNDFADPAE